jgi:putative ABC transport system substrate-binding protein
LGHGYPVDAQISGKANRQFSAAIAERQYVAELLALAPDIILASGTSVGPLLQLIHDVPIVFVNVVDPVGKAAAVSLGVEATVAPVRDASDLASMIATQARGPNSGLVVIPDAFTIGHRAEITLLAARYGVPAIYWTRSFAELGGLISYGPDSIEPYRRAASYADRILKGEKPADLPVQRPSTFELAINLKTAKALGLNVPANLLALVDEVIE